MPVLSVSSPRPASPRIGRDHLHGRRKAPTAPSRPHNGGDRPFRLLVPLLSPRHHHPPDPPDAKTTESLDPPDTRTTESPLTGRLGGVPEVGPILNGGNGPEDPKSVCTTLRRVGFCCQLCLLANLLAPAVLKRRQTPYFKRARHGPNT